ncbi:MAG: arginine repressor [Defluviitaleaceae bacterium]|nr:arginine repressor [Defluviitaleaceae bacterium]
MKSNRHAAILELIQKHHIASQVELTQALADEGYSATQSTISRDIRELGLSLERTPKGLRLVAPTQHAMDRLLKSSITSVASSGNMMVVRTRSGMAMAVALTLDEMELEEVLGCVAGDDTVICVITCEQKAKALKERLG